MINPILFYVGLGAFWLVGAVGAFRCIQIQAEEDAEDKVAGVCACLIFWWLVLLVFTTTLAWKAGANWSQRMKELREVKPLKSGMDNGLYEPVPKFE